MNKEFKMRFVGVITILAFGLSSCQTEMRKSNIIFVMVDDLGYRDVGFNGSSYYETPNIDALAEESLIFNQSYMYPTCSPSRTALFTGKHSFRTGVYTVPVLEKGTSEENIFSRWTVGREHPIYAEPLAEAGYKSIHLGKWHIVGPYPQQELSMDWPIKEKLGQPNPGDFSWAETHKTPEVEKYYPTGRGFMRNVGGTFRGDPALEEGGYKSETGGYRSPFSNPFIEKKPDDEWLTDRLMDDAIEFIDEYKDDPFFVNLHFYAVHRPIKYRSEELLQKYLNKPGDSITGQGTGKQRERMAAYATMIESMDDNIAKLITYLEENDLRENTMIIFTSDNGYHGGVSSDKLVRGAKGYIYEGGIKVPTFINWPGKIRARRTEVPISVIDYFPTLMDVAGVKYNGQLDGVTITSAFQRDIETYKNRPLFWHIASQYKHGACSAIRKGDFKLIQFLKDGELELYDLSNDPMESENLAEVNTKMTNELLAELVAWRAENEVPLPPNSILPN